VVLAADTSEDEKNNCIEFYNGGKLMLRVVSDYKTKLGDPSLETLAMEKQAPLDMTTISDVVPYKVGSLDGYRRLLVVSDPAYRGLEYITKDSESIYRMLTFADTESVEIVNMLKTFTAN